MSAADWEPRERGWAIAVAVTMLGAVLYPVRQNWRPEDKRNEGFPLSYYSMFTVKRETTHPVRYLVGIRADGSRVHLPGRLIGSGGMNQVRYQINRVVDEGWTDEYVHTFAAKLGTRKKYADVARVQIVEGFFHLDEFMFTRELNPEQEDVLAEAEVPRKPAKSDEPDPAARVDGALGSGVAQ